MLRDVTSETAETDMQTVLKNTSCINADFSNPLKPKVNWSNLLSASDPVITDRQKQIHKKSLLLSNGLTSAYISFSGNKDKKLTFKLHRTYIQTENTQQYLKSSHIGSIMICPKGNITAHNMRLVIWNAQAEGKIITDRGSVFWYSFIEKETDTLILKTLASGNEKGIRAAFKPAGNIYESEKDHFKSPVTPGCVNKKITDKITIGNYSAADGTGGASAFFTMRGVCKKEKIYIFAARRNDKQNKRQTPIREILYNNAVNAIINSLKTGTGRIKKQHYARWHNYLSDSILTIPENPDSEQIYWLEKYKKGISNLLTQTLHISQGEINNYIHTLLDDANLYNSASKGNVPVQYNYQSCIDKMVISSHDRTVHIFPKIIFDNIVFDRFKLNNLKSLRFSAQMQKGKTCWIKIHSNETADLILKTDMNKFKASGCRNCSVQRLKDSSESVRFKIRIPAGKTLFLKAV